jgi:tetratricopeptide (TPR) repeat protein
MLIHTGWPEEAYRHAEQALQATWWTADLTNEIQAYGALANSAYLAGQIDLARLHAQKGLWVCERAQAGSKMGALQIILARAELALGNLDEGWQQLHAALSLGERWQDQVVIQQGNQLKAHLSLFAGDLEQAGELLMGQNQTELLRYESLDNLLFICMVPAFEKNAAGGIRFLEEKLAITRRVDPVQPNLPGKLARAVLLWLEGQPGEAVEITRQVEEEARLRGFGCLPNAAALLRVQILQNLGRAQEALGEIKAVNAWAEQSQDPWMQIQTTRLLTRMEMGSDFSAGDVNRSLASKIARLEAGATLEAVHKLLEKIKGKILD